MSGLEPRLVLEQREQPSAERSQGLVLQQCKELAVPRSQQHSGPDGLGLARPSPVLRICKSELELVLQPPWERNDRSELRRARPLQTLRISLFGLELVPQLHEGHSGSSVLNTAVLPRVTHSDTGGL